jgi:hypothetical protein
MIKNTRKRKNSVNNNIKGNNKGNNKGKTQKQTMKGINLSRNQNKFEDISHNNTINNLLSKNSDGEYIYKFYKSNDDSTIKKDPKRCMCINYKSMDDFQTYDRCPNTALDGTDFCQLHQNCKSYLRQFLSGSESEPDQELWKDPLVEGSHNCYSYFLNRQVKAVREKCYEICNKKYKNVEKCINDSGCGDLKPQPGDFDLIKRTGSDKSKLRIYKCPELQAKILKDNPTIVPVAFNTKCPNGYYKGAMTIEPNSTYHFYKQVDNGLFYHKPGLNPVSTVDSAFEGERGRPIYIPHFSNRDYTKEINNNDDDDGINYTSFCSYYCIPQNNKVHKNLA